MNDEKIKKRVVLVVDDDESILKIVRISLKVFGYSVITANSGEEALRLVEREKPDIMLLDVLMPEMDGLETLKRLRTVSDIPVIVFSARSSSREEALKRGANDFIAKPFTPERLAQKISAVLDAMSNNPAGNSD